jgi:hypothetical protein
VSPVTRSIAKLCSTLEISDHGYLKSKKCIGFFLLGLNVLNMIKDQVWNFLYMLASCLLEG